MLTVLDKYAREKATIYKYTRGIEETETVLVEIKVADFKQEASEFKLHSFDDFFKSAVFLRSYTKEGELIKCTRRL